MSTQRTRTRHGSASRLLAAAVSCALVFGSSGGLAGTSRPAPSAAAGAPLASKPAGKESAGDVTLRVAAETLGGALASGLWVLLAVLVIDGASSNSGDAIFYAVVFGMVFLAASIAVVPAGIYGGGELAGGDSSYGATVGGYASGLAVGVIITAAFDGLSGDPLWGIPVTWLLAIAGGVIGYELAHEPESDEAIDQALGLLSGPSSASPARPRSPGPFVTPAGIGRGAVIGMSWSF